MLTLNTTMSGYGRPDSPRRRALGVSIEPPQVEDSVASRETESAGRWKCAPASQQIMQQYRMKPSLV
jgi:hypothetical protein